MRRLRVGVAGMGIGQAHLLAYLSLTDRFEVAAIAEVDDARRERAAADWGVAKAVPSVEDLLELDLDVVDLCTPPWLHADQVVAALDAGRHVVCEKPLAPSLAEIDRIEAAAAASPATVMPIFQYRFAPGAARLKALVDAGVCGSLHLATSETAWTRGPDYFEVQWRGRWETEGGGAVLSHATHLHDLVTWLGGPVRSVSGLAATLVNDVETEDTAAAVIELDQPGRAAPAIGSLSVTLGSATEISRLRLCYEHVTAESCTEPYDPGAEPWTFSFSDPSVQAAAERIWSDLAPVAPGYEGQLGAFHAAITDEAELPVTLRDARKAVELVTAWYTSARTGERVGVPVDPSAPEYTSLAPGG